MIRSFACADTHHLYLTGKSRRWTNVRAVAQRKLDQMHAVMQLIDLGIPPGNRLEALHGDRRGQHSIRINDPWRICFTWHPDGAHGVEIVDCHSSTVQGNAMIKQSAEGWSVHRVTTHPGEILREDFLRPMGMTAHALATRTRMPATRVGEILHGRRSVSTDTALRLARFFGTSAEFWINLQTAYDLSKARMEIDSTIQNEVQPLAISA
jgi:addiction module HigA family antidote